ncbi:unnamed protein product [Trichobilharzia szidati]|nr:unnamed protein product [Trichobilharzia szidati]
MHVKNSSYQFDEEIITYLEGIVESCDYDELDEVEFLTMCGAYIPQLIEIPKEIFLEWFSSVSDSIKNKSQAHGTGNSDHQNTPISSNNSKEIKKNYELKDQNTDRLCEHCCTNCRQIDADESVKTLASILPDACRNILKDCLQTTNNNVDEAVLLALNRITLNSNSNNNSDNTTGKELNTSKRNKTIVTASKSSPSTTTTTTTADIDEKLDEKAKSLVLDRYDFVSEGGGGGGGGQLAKPKLPSEYEKKQSHIRYIDGKPVDTGGKKYIEIKTEYPNMPLRTFLKALKQYKFH